MVKFSYRTVQTDDVIAEFSPRAGMEDPDGGVHLVGHHLVDETRLADAVDNAGRTGDVTFLTTFPGCYSVVLRHARGLAAYADPVGQFPLYLARSSDRTLISSRASWLAAEIGDSVDPVSVAARLACPDTPDLFPARTMFPRVARVPDGTIVHIGSHGVQRTAHRGIRTDRAMTMADAAELVRARLLASIRARTRVATQLTADLSGGYDSTSLAFLAAADGTPADTLTSYEAGAVVDTDDTHRARGFARLAAGTTHHMVPRAADHLPFQELVAAVDEPHEAPLYLGSLRTRLTVAHDLGADMHLVGEGGDTVLSAPPAYLADLVRRGDLAAVWQHCLVWARLRTRSPLALFRRAVIVGATSRRQSLTALARDIERGRPPDTSSWEDDWVCHLRRPRADWLTVRARRALAAGVRDLAEQAGGADGVADRITRSWLRGQTLTQRAVRDAGLARGIAVHAPFLDADVVRACLALSAHRRANPTMPKPLLRTALSGLVPAAVLVHPAKGDYTWEAYHGVRRAAPALRALFAESAAADLGVLEPAPVRVMLDRAIQGLPTPWGALNQAIAVELWLRANQERL